MYNHKRKQAFGTAALQTPEPCGLLKQYLCKGAHCGKKSNKTPSMGTGEETSGVLNCRPWGAVRMPNFF